MLLNLIFMSIILPLSLVQHSTSAPSLSLTADNETFYSFNTIEATELRSKHTFLPSSSKLVFTPPHLPTSYFKTCCTLESHEKIIKFPIPRWNSRPNKSLSFDCEIQKSMCLKSSSVNNNDKSNL